MYVRAANLLDFTLYHLLHIWKPTQLRVFPPVLGAALDAATAAGNPFYLLKLLTTDLPQLDTYHNKLKLAQQSREASKKK